LQRVRSNRCGSRGKEFPNHLACNAVVRGLCYRQLNFLQPTALNVPAQQYQSARRLLSPFKVEMKRRWCVLVVLVFAVAVPLWAQTPVNDRPHRLVVNHSVVADVPRSHALPTTPLKASTESASALEVRPVVEALTRALTATPHLRAADTAAGMALIAIGTRSRHPKSAAVFIGVHAIQLGLGRKSPLAWRTFEVQPDIGRGRFAITLRRTIGESR